MRAVAFIPEVATVRPLSRKIKLSSALWLLPPDSRLARNLRAEIEAGGYTVSGGSYLYFDGNLKADGTLYEVFQGYCLALTYFYPQGRATCRAFHELGSPKKVELFIDEYDKFAFDPDDLIKLERKRIRSIDRVFARVEAQLETAEFNPLRNAVEFFIWYLSEPRIRTRLLYLSICLESLLLEGEGEGIAYKLGMRCASLLDAFDQTTTPESVLLQVRNGYTLRSKIIHGSDYAKESTKLIKRGHATTELDHVLSLEKIVKHTFSVIFAHEDLYDASRTDELASLIDTKYLLGTK